MDTEETLVGVGVTLDVQADGSPCVYSVCKGGSAEAYLQPGDTLLAIGDESVLRASSQQIANLLLGPPGTTVDISVRRQSSVPGHLTGERITAYEDYQFQLTRKATDPRIARSAIVTRDTETPGYPSSEPAPLLGPGPVVSPPLSQEEHAKILERGDDMLR